MSESSFKSKKENLNNKNNSFSAWIKAVQIYLSPAVLRMLVLGFVAGVPLALVFGTLTYRLRSFGIDRATIGFFSWIILLYSIKFFWAPAVDKFRLPLLYRVLGKRRSWLIVAQFFLVSGLFGMAVINPTDNIKELVIFTAIVVFSSTVQDIVIDAYRIESANNNMQAAMSAMYVSGYRLGMLLAGGATLWMVGLLKEGELTLPAVEKFMQNIFHINFVSNLHFYWFVAYACMALVMLCCMLFTFFIPEPNSYREKEVYKNIEDFFKKVVVAPFADFFWRYKKQAIFLLLLIGLYNISNLLVGAMSNTFYVDAGYSEKQVATIIKLYGTAMTISGTFIGGVLVFRYGVRLPLFIGTCGALLNNLLFAVLYNIGFNLYFLTAVISIDNLAVGIASTSLIAFMSGITNQRYTATQFALFSSVVYFLPKLLAGFSGVFVNHLGYSWFFILSASLSVPIMVLVYYFGNVHQLNNQ